ncbi:MAG: BspA family leucine-rich repeat surface protein, partial [Prevotella sp.]|nr:BspA family leucine-rich repeat surface protein [Prevotella sp.]
MKQKLLLLFMAMLAMTANASRTWTLYAVVNGTELTIKAAHSGAVPDGGIQHTSDDENWNSSFRDQITTAVIDGTCINYDNSSLKYLFYRCSKLESISNLSKFSAVGRMWKRVDLSYMFYGCSSLTSLDVSGLRTEYATTMAYMFRGCSGLTSLDLSSFNTANVTNMSSMFLECTNLASLDISNFNTEKVTSMSDMFCGCRALTSLDLSHFNTSNVTTMDWMFQNCQNLTALDISTFNTEKVTSMYDM